MLHLNFELYFRIRDSWFLLMPTTGCKHMSWPPRLSPWYWDFKLYFLYLIVTLNKFSNQFIMPKSYWTNCNNSRFSRTLYTCFDYWWTNQIVYTLTHSKLRVLQFNISKFSGEGLPDYSQVRRRILPPPTAPCVSCTSVLRPRFASTNLDFLVYQK